VVFAKKENKAVAKIVYGKIFVNGVYMGENNNERPSYGTFDYFINEVIAGSIVLIWRSLTQINCVRDLSQKKYE
jgi:hypothetical protein